MSDRVDQPASGEADSRESQSPARSPAERRRDVLTLDLPLVFGLTLCTVLTIVEATRAVGGNSRSWAYTFEWPLIGAFICWIWYRYRVSARRPGARTAAEAEPPANPGDPRTGLPTPQRAPEARSGEGAPAESGAAHGEQAEYGFAALGRSLTSRWRAQVAEAQAAYDREHDEALRAWEEYSRGVQEQDAQLGASPDPMSANRERVERPPR